MIDSKLDQILNEAKGEYPVASKIAREICELSPLALASQLNYLIDHWGKKFWERAEYLGKLAEAVGGKSAQSVVEFTMETLRAQAMFMETREYAHKDFETALRDVYDNAEVMEGYYYQGLMLSQAYWPIHFDMHEYFLQDFLPRIPAGSKGTEIGFGHGLYLLRILSAHPEVTLEGFDVSPYSVPYATKLLTAGGIDPSRYQLGFADIRYPLERPDDSYEWGIFAEILEHIPDPLSALKELHRILKPGAPLFITTVVDSNAMDHLYMYEDIQAIRDMVNEGGFRIVSEKAMRVADYVPESRDPTIDVALVAIRD